jgi:tryptophan-rich sensory protein
MSTATRSTPHRPARPILGLIASIALTWAVAIISSAAGPDAWFRTLNKPAWNPPDWVFAPVWMTLYTLMAVAAWRIWRARGWSAAKVPLALYALQLLLNGIWSPLFFGLHRPDLAFIDIVLLWFAIVATTALFFRHDRAAGWLMLPYLAWVSFASVLNCAIWRMNA